MKKSSFERSNRIYFKRNRLSYWISLATKFAGGQKSLARITGIRQSNIYCYIHDKTLSIRGDILSCIMNFLNNNHIDNTKLLKDIKEITDVDEHRRRTIGGAREALIKKYGETAFEYIQSKSRKVLYRKYGKDCMKLLSKKGCKRLREKYGKNAFKIVTSKGFKTLEKKYGKNWRSVVGRLSYESRKKYGTVYSRRPTGIVYRRKKLTKQENKVVDLLKKRNIEYQTHVMLGDYYECDIIIPSIDKPRICLEVSNTSPQPSNLYRKISQVFVRRMLLPTCKFILLIPESKRGKNQIWHARPDLVQFLLDEGIIVFWSTEIDKLINFLQLFLRRKDCTSFLNEKYEWCKKYFENRRKHALYSAQKATRILESEKKIIEKLNLTGSKKAIFNRYNWPIVVDLSNGNMLYEITTASGHSALETISGKIFYSSKTLSEYKLNLISYSKKDFPTKELIENLCKIITVG